MSVYQEAGLPAAGEPTFPAGVHVRRPARPRQLSLRVALLTLLVGLLVATVGSIGLVQWVTSVRAIRELENKSFQMLVLTLSSQVQNFLEPGMLALQEAQTLAAYGRLSVDDTDALAVYLVDRLRYQRTLSWLSYSDAATGRFVGAWRDGDGQVVLNVSAPDVDGGRPAEAVVQVDGSRTAYTRALPGGYDPRATGWYAQAVAAEGVSWTEPFEFNEGRRGVTAALALHDPATHQLRGVFTADIFLDDLSRYLATVLAGYEGKATVLSRHGAVVARSYRPDESPGAGLLAAGLAAMPVSLADMPSDRPLSFTFDYDDVRYVVAGQMLRIPGGPDWATAYWMPEAQFLDALYREQRLAVALGVLFLVVAVTSGILLASRIAAPLHAIARDLEQVARFNLLHAPRGPSFVAEVAVVRDSTERVKASLESFGRYVPRDIVRELLARGEEARLGGETRCLTIHFSDVVNFTQLSEGLPPAEVVEHLAAYLQVMTQALAEHGGTIDKFMGDGILAFFNAPHELPQHAALACRAALAAQGRLAARQDRWRADGRPVFQARIGLHIGDVLVGNIGTAERFAYTVIGDTVNLASRLEILNKVYGTRILASQEVRDAAGPGFEWRRVDRVAVVGRTADTVVNELLGLRGQVAPAVLAAREQYEQALAAYFARRFAEAEAGFRAAAGLTGNRAAELMRRRAEAFSGYPPPDDWDGVYMLSSKG